MSRSIKKGPFCDASLMKKVEAQNKANKHDVIKTWSRRSVIFPSFVSHTFAVHNGKEHIPVYVTAANGTITVTSDGKTYDISVEKGEKQ